MIIDGVHNPVHLDIVMQLTRNRMIHAFSHAHECCFTSSQINHTAFINYGFINTTHTNELFLNNS